jgi:hypothetical protein
MGVALGVNLKSAVIIWSCSAGVAAVAGIVLGIAYRKLSREKFSPAELQQLRGIIQNKMAEQTQELTRISNVDQQRLAAWAGLNWA